MDSSGVKVIIRIIRRGSAEDICISSRVQIRTNTAGCGVRPCPSVGKAEIVAESARLLQGL